MTTTTTTSEAGPVQWNEIEARVLKHLDMKDPTTLRAVERWRKDVATVTEESTDFDVIHTFSAPDVVDATIAYFLADIEENRAIERFQVTQQAKRSARVAVETALAEHDGCFVDRENGDRVVPERLSVARVNGAKGAQRVQRIIDASERLARQIDGDTGPRPVFPHALEQYETDLREFILVNGEAGRMCIQRLCRDRDYAESTALDQRTPKPVRFLAQLVIASASTQRIPDPHRSFGFASRR